MAQGLSSYTKSSKFKRIFKVVIVALCLCLIFCGISRFGIPVKVSKGDVSIFEDVHVDIPNNQKAYILYFPHFVSYHEGFSYQDDTDNPRVKVNIFETKRDDWQRRIAKDANKTVLSTDGSVFRRDPKAQVIGVPREGSSCDLYINYYERYYYGTITGPNIKTPSDALNLLGKNILSADSELERR